MPAQSRVARVHSWVPNADFADSYNWYDALPTIEANPTFN